MDLRKIRSFFPVLSRKISGKHIVYLDSAASSLKPYQVRNTVSDYFDKYPVNIFRGIYKLSQEASFEFEKSRDIVAEFINAKSKNEIVFVRNTTEAINLIATSYAENYLDNDSEILTSVMEHHANLVPWQMIAKKKQVKIKYIDIKEGLLDLDSLYDAINRKTALVALNHVSNVLGTINPLKKIIKKIKKINPKVKVLIDAAQSVGHFHTDVVDLGCDFLSFSAHKMFGPTGVGVLWGKYDILDSMSCYQYGGDMIEKVELDKSRFKKPPAKFEAGTPDICGVLGLREAIFFIKKIGFDQITKHDKILTELTLKVLNEFKGISIYGPKDTTNRSAVISFNIAGIHPHDLAQILDMDNICIRSGHHCAMPLHKKLNIPASARVSLYIYNTPADIEKLALGIKKAIKIFN
jgi:cysteine desulfurase/selenocysteine lyase